jgi:hypothetical protein
LKNPFLVYSPEEIDATEFKETFVKEHTWINALETPKDHLIYGSRGSGKSMLLYYLEFEHQLCYFENNLQRLLERNDNKYIGILVDVKPLELDTYRYELLLKNNLNQKEFIQDLCSTDLTAAVLCRIIKTLTENPEMAKFINSLPIEHVKGFCTSTIMELDTHNIHSLRFKAGSGTDLLNRIAEILARERDLIRNYANERFQAREAHFGGNYISFEVFLNFIKRLKLLIARNDISFYILIDNGDFTKNTMQLCIDKLISQREHKDICFKVAIKKGSFWNRGEAQWPHDYSQIDIDELYSTQHTVYYDRVREIADKRLSKENVNISIEQFLPESLAEKELLEEIKKELEEKYTQEYHERSDKGFDEEPRQTKSDFVSNRVNKYAQAELFRRVKKAGKSYAGFNNIVHLSSGIIRQFLDICTLMYSEEVKRRGDNVNQISLQSQNSVIKIYADSFIDELEKKYKGLEYEGNQQEAKYYKGLYFLVEALGACYKERLLNPELKEPRVFTFTLKDRIDDPDIERILQIGVNENYFQSYWYSSKIGVGKYRGYAFNRRLCPRYSIDHTSFRGRIELTVVDIAAAIKSGKIPKAIYLQEEESPITLDDFSLSD